MLSDLDAVGGEQGVELAARFVAELKNHLHQIGVAELIAKIGCHFVVLVARSWAGFAFAVSNSGHQIAAQDRGTESETRQQCEREQAFYSIRRLHLPKSPYWGFDHTRQQEYWQNPLCRDRAKVLGVFILLRIKDLARFEEEMNARLV
jgi:hypothetical protein